MQKVGISILLFFGMLNLIPPLFSEGGIFDVQYKAVNECGELTMYHGLYFDNAYFTILYLSIAYLCFVLPFVFKMNKHISRVAFMFSAWNLTALIFEVLNIFTPDQIFNSGGNSANYTFYALTITFGLAAIITTETWIKQKRLDK
jgi:magnesium-transporting ATPase (P-type)